MIYIGMSESKLEYDLYALTKAFFPRKTPFVFYPKEQAAFVEGGQTALERLERQGTPSGLLLVRFETDAIRMRWVKDPAGIQKWMCLQEGENLLLCEAWLTGLWAKPQGERTGRWAVTVREEGISGWTDLGESLSAAEVKNRAKRLLYRIFEKSEGRGLPWGSLNGVRPGKIPMKLLEEGWAEPDIRRYMREKYLVSESKINLILDIAQRERRLLSGLRGRPWDGYSLYIGIPFCPTTCLYCSFPSYPASAWREKMDAYLEAVFRELDWTAEHFAGRRLDSIYIGGGTPTTLSAKQLDALCARVRALFDLSSLREWTVEAGRPDSITAEKLAVLKAGGTDRISVNPQSMKQETLQILGRAHTIQQVENAVYLARSAGFENLNMDIILGLPKETPEDVRRTVEKIAALSPDNLTVHALALKRSSRLKIEWETYEESVMRYAEEQMRIAQEAAAAMGMRPYYLYRQKNIAGNQENAGYATPGKEGYYNVLIMEEVQDIVAIGAGAVSKRVFADGQTRRAENVKDAKRYIARTEEMIERKQRLYFEGETAAEVPRR